jgi:predicted glycogen debranching enzyme
MEPDGLISAGSGDDQVTWMDVNVDGILPTPRHGKPVEINAYWYSALRIMFEFSKLLGKDQKDYLDLSEKVKASFLREFWSDSLGCLKDLASGTPNDNQIRCNQIWAVSVPFTMLDNGQQRKVVDRVFEFLYTPVGLRSLAPNDPEFHPIYRGSNVERDLAYHQGTVWGFPLGAYYLAYLKANNYVKEAVADVKDQLEAIEPTLREGCIGQIAEIFDGEYPAMSRGCFAQAWSVAEVLRAFRAVQDISLRHGHQ